MNSLRWFLLSSLIACFASCVSQKEIAYFQNIPNDSTASSIAVDKPYTPTIRIGDLLIVNVSSLNPEATTFFNPYTLQSIGQPMQQNGPGSTTPIPATPGYLVSSEGTIELPLIGKIQVVGSTIAQTTDRIRDLLKKYLKEPTVNVRNANFRISVLGEVVRPSLFTIPNEQITLPEALALAGDITIYGQRNNVLLVRETNGKRTFIRLDLTRRDLFSSPYYYLHPNDVIYVEPSRGRVTSTDRLYQIAPIALSSLSFLVIILNYFR